MEDKSLFGWSPQVVAALAYWGGWPASVAIFLAERRNRFVRFHAAQGIYTFGTLIGTFTAVAWLDAVLARRVPRRVNAAIGMGSSVFLAALVAAWLVMPILALTGRRPALPLVGAPATRVATLTGVPGTESPTRAGRRAA
jgi:uncharacterized membrane protein